MMNNGCVYADKINADKIKKTLKIKSEDSNNNNSNTSNANNNQISLIEYYVTNYPHSSEEVWRQKITDGLITIDGTVTIDPDVHIKHGQLLEYHRPPWFELAVPTEFPILHEDKNVLVLNKPTGISVLPGGKFYLHTMVHMAQDKFANNELAPVHRLGRGTTGSIIFTKNGKSRSFLMKMFRENKVKKFYMALISGIPEQDTFTINQPIGQISYEYCPLEKLWAATPDGKASTSHFKVIKRNKSKNQSLVEVKIETGRAHQIRIHSAFAGHPLVGDPLYVIGGLPRATKYKKHQNPDEFTLLGDRRDAVPSDGGYHLHSWKISFPDPDPDRPNEMISVVCPPPPILQQELDESE